MMFKRTELKETKDGLCLFIHSPNGVSWVQTQSNKAYFTDGNTKWDSMKEINDIGIVKKFIGLCYRSYSIDIQICESKFLPQLIDECVLEGSQYLREEALTNHVSLVQMDTIIKILPQLSLELGKSMYQELLKRGCSKVDVMFYAHGNNELEKFIESQAEKEVFL